MNIQILKLLAVMIGPSFHLSSAFSFVISFQDNRPLGKGVYIYFTNEETKVPQVYCSYAFLTNSSCNLSPRLLSPRSAICLCKDSLHPGVRRKREALQPNAVWDVPGLHSLTAKKTGRRGLHLAERVAPGQSVGSSKLWEFSALPTWLFLSAEGGRNCHLNKADNRKIIPI